MARYFHGGPAGIRSEIKPAAETKMPSCSSYGAAGIHRRDRVYLTTDFDAALLYACGFPRGWRTTVYEVEPVGAVEPDPDWFGAAGVSVQCERARIIRAYPVPGKTIKKVRRQILAVA